MKMPVLGIIAALSCGNLVCGAEAPGGGTASEAGGGEFAFTLYSKVASGKVGNVFLSPYSVSTALTMAYAGAAGETEKQMAKALRLSGEKSRIFQDCSVLQKKINADDGKGIQLRAANALWLQKGHKFLDAYLKTMNGFFDGALKEADFRADCGGARKAINSWAEEKTERKIKDLIPPKILDPMTRLVITNAVYFKGEWKSRFNKEFNKEMPFNVSEGRIVPAQMMRQELGCQYCEDDKVQMLALPYKGQAAMYVILPREMNGIADLEKNITAAKFAEWRKALATKNVQLMLPKFKIDDKYKLNEYLKAMGMEDAFAPTADFSGIDGLKDLYISAVLHKTFADVNEEGTEAAAATAVVMREKSAAPSQKIVFKADHPFIFLIVHETTGEILFIGRLAMPEAG